VGITLDEIVLTDDSQSIAIGNGSGTLLSIAALDSVASGAENAIVMAGIRQDTGGSPVSSDGDLHPFLFNNDGELKVAADLSSSVGDDDADSGNPVKIGSRAVDGLLSAVSATNDRADLLSDMYRRLWINNSANVGMQSSQETVTAVAAEVLSSPLAGRRFVTIQNQGNQDVFIGHDATLTSANGIKVPKKSSATYELGEDIDIFMISSSGSQDVRFLEAG